jgi:hypothetical protein
MAGKEDRPEEWLRMARRVLRRRPQAVGLVPLGRQVDSAAISRRLGRALAVLTGEVVGVFDSWRRWRGTATNFVLPESATDGVVVLPPPVETDGVLAAFALEEAVMDARASFATLVVDLGGLPLRHPSTIACADVLVTAANAGQVRERQLHTLRRVLPDDRNLGVLLIG